MTVTKNTLIGDLLANDMNTARFLFEMGMHCVGSVSYTHLDVYKRQHRERSICRGAQASNCSGL